MRSLTVCIWPNIDSTPVSRGKITVMKELIRFVVSPTTPVNMSYTLRVAVRDEAAAAAALRLLVVSESHSGAWLESVICRGN